MRKAGAFEPVGPLESSLCVVLFFSCVESSADAMAFTTTLFTTASFPGIGAYDYLVPTVGVTAAARDVRPPHVLLTLSDGRTITVFDTVRTAMRCLEKMRVAKQSFLVASDDVLIWAVSWTKLIIAEATLTLQRLMTSFTPVYMFGFTRFVHRNLSSVQTFGEALQSVGFANMGGSATIQNNMDLATAATRAVVVDWLYKAAPTADAPGKDTEQTELKYNWRTLVRGQAPPG